LGTQIDAAHRNSRDIVILVRGVAVRAVTLARGEGGTNFISARVFINAHAKPQLHRPRRFSLARFAAGSREISNGATDADTPIFLVPVDLRPRDSCMRRDEIHRRLARSVPVILPLSVFSFSPPPRLVFLLSPVFWRIHDCTHRFFILLEHVYPHEGNVRRKKTCRRNASANSVPLHAVRLTASTMAEKRGTKYLICIRAKLAHCQMTRVFHFTYCDRVYYRPDLLLPAGEYTRNFTAQPSTLVSPFVGLRGMGIFFAPMQSL